MKTIQVLLNGQQVEATTDMTVLELAEKNNIPIPTLCKDRRLEAITSCFVCVVEVKGARTLVPSCATKVTEKMEIQTHSEEVVKARKTALELIMSNHYGDCYAPCRVNCPAHTDCQGYTALAAHGRLQDAIVLMKERIPFPASLGRVCPAFCEDYCRRQYVEQPVAIRQMKRYLAEKDLFSENPYIPSSAPKVGKKVAVVGGGPGGLAGAYYLAQLGVDVEVFEAKAKPGGMIVYGVPSYRLPVEIVDKEIETIKAVDGVTIHTNKRLGKDFTLDDLRKDGFEAILLTMGAWNSRKMRIDGEDLDGVYDGIEYLEKLNEEGTVDIKGRVAVIGGGNTAFDCARSALRLGADEVVMVYRRTKKEMPANDIEITEGEEEGIIFNELTIPLDIKKANGRLAVTLQKMELGEPDDSGRRRPVPVTGSEFTEEFDYILSAIGQTPDYECLGADKDSLLQGGRWIPYSENTGQSVAMNDVFLAGDFATGAATVVEAIATARDAIESIYRFVTGCEDISNPKEYTSAKTDLEDANHPFYAGFEEDKRRHPGMMAPDVRNKTFKEYEECFVDKDAIEEAKRCLECGCTDIYQCSLKEYSDEYKAEQSYYGGEMNKPLVDDSHQHLMRDPGKCILCGRCVDLCEQNVAVGVYGFVNRGFSTIVNPEFNKGLAESNCISCGTCISGCPVGAIVPKETGLKMVPIEGKKVESVCMHCSVGCKNYYEILSDSIYEVHEKDNYLCKKGRFYFPKFITNKTDQKALEALKDIKDAVVYPSASLSAEEYEALKKAAGKMNWKLVNYYSQSTLWQAFAKKKSLPKMDFFTRAVKTNSVIICAGDIENTNEVVINRIALSGLEDTVIYHINKEATKRLSFLRARHVTNPSGIDMEALKKYDEVILLINPVDFDASYGTNAALELYNALSTLELRTTLFSNTRNIYSFYDADKMVEITGSEKKVYIKTEPSGDALILDHTDENRALSIGFSFQNEGTYLNSKNQVYKTPEVLNSGVNALHDVLSKVLGIQKAEPVKHKTMDKESALDAVTGDVVEFPGETIKKFYITK